MTIKQHLEDRRYFPDDHRGKGAARRVTSGSLLRALMQDDKTYFSTAAPRGYTPQWPCTAGNLIKGTQLGSHLRALPCLRPSPPAAAASAASVALDAAWNAFTRTSFGGPRCIPLCVDAATY